MTRQATPANLIVAGAGDVFWIITIPGSDFLDDDVQSRTVTLYVEYMYLPESRGYRCG